MHDSNLSLPPIFLRRLEDLLDDEYIPFGKVYSRPATTGLRLNTLKIDNPNSLIDASINAGLQSFNTLQQVSWCQAGYFAYEDIQAGKHPYHAAGLYYLQDPSAMAVAEILAPQPGERVLDISAAPGGKSTHLATLMNNQGLLVANEIHPRRVWELAENLERCGVTNAAILNETPENLAAHFDAYFDRVLVDAPCSGEGMFRKSAAARQGWSPELVRSCAIRQSVILNEAVKMVCPGGWLAYSTCTFNPQENEAVIAALLQASPEFELVEIVHREGFSPGRPEWVTGGPAALLHCVRMWPHLAPGEGHFVALLQKSRMADQVYSGFVRTKSSKLDQDKFSTFSAFCQAALKRTFTTERLALVGSYLYQLPPGLPGLEGLKVIHPGWWLGTFKTDRFEPSHALALGLRAEDANQALNFGPGSPEILTYLHGGTLASTGENGWVLVCVDGFPLGWGKRSHGVVKNYYPKGLRSLAWRD